ncbi:hypothetical protein ACEQPO_13755 [Bacillus sp. SL00103]
MLWRDRAGRSRKPRLQEGRHTIPIITKMNRQPVKLAAELEETYHIQTHVVQADLKLKNRRS